MHLDLVAAWARLYRLEHELRIRKAKRLMELRLLDEDGKQSCGSGVGCTDSTVIALNGRSEQNERAVPYSVSLGS
jgi:hypothetical protein